MPIPSLQPLKLRVGYPGWGAGQARRAEHLDRAREGFLLRPSLLPSTSWPGNPALRSGCGVWGCGFLMRPLLVHTRHVGHEGV